MPTDWIYTLRVGDVFMLLCLIGIVVAVVRVIYVPIAQKARAFYSEWNEVKYRTRDFQNELVQTHQAQEYQIKSVYEALKSMEERGFHRYAEGGAVLPRNIQRENEVKFIVEDGYGQIIKEYTDPVTYPNPYLADPKPRWDRYMDMPEEQEKNDPKPDSENEESNDSTE